MNWQEYQDAVGELYAQMDDIGCVRKNITLPDKETGQARQIDVWLEYKFKGHTIGILVDAKYRKEKLDVKDVEEVIALADAVGATKSVIVALSGWTGPAGIKAQLKGMDLKLWTLEQALNQTRPNKKIQFLLSLLDSTDEKYKYQAINDLADFGVDASAAIPQLISILQDEDTQLHTSASIALAKIGKESVPFLADLLQHKSLKVRRRVASTLEQIGSQAEAAIPQLIHALEDNDPDGDIRWYAVITIAKIGVPAKEAIPALIQRLRDSKAGIRAWTLYALGRMGYLAKEAETVISEEILPQEEPNDVGNSVVIAGIEALDAIGFNIDEIQINSTDDNTVRTAREWVLLIREEAIKARNVKKARGALEYQRPLSVYTPPQKDPSQFRQIHSNK
ncbi:HEAT repeat domain-containing protein [Dolichospermum heterosporum]|uniref:HEAT repeat domain-containing protein n=1 Tax=Dolichospermum heterosporum TAC447 TaxID=747523 RepID=A0ABY5M0I2_9CYAN|nr:HEAT repeat domain-containing protein [Dolichospermum heterosporum]UUO16581.1 HEAT repeat domain-containing protein [Dolichospermum heterosporum TAC447]